MSQNINKIVAFAIGISVMSGSIMSVFAADVKQTAQSVQAKQITNLQAQTSQKNVLTLEDSIKAAIDSSETLALEEKKISYLDKTNNINEKIDDNTKTIDDDQKDYNDDKRELNLKQLKQQRDFDEDLLRKKVTDKYNDIVTRQLKINKAIKDLEVKNKKLEEAKLKQTLGITTEIDLKTTQLEIENLKNSQKSSQNLLKDSEYSFKVLTGKDLTDCSLEQDVKFEQFKIDASIDKYLDNVIDSYLKFSDQLNELNKDYLDDNKVDEPKKPSVENTAPTIPKYNDDPSFKNDDGTVNLGNAFTAYEEYKKNLDIYNSKKQVYVGQLSARLAYLQSKLGTYQSETTLNETKKKFKDQLKSFYTSLLASEENIKFLKQNIELNNEKLSKSKLKNDLGIMTQSDYNTQVVSSQDLDLQLRNEIINYNKLKEELQKPWIAFSSAQ